MATSREKNHSWADLLDEPTSVLGAYKGQPPSLSSFAPHAVRIGFDEIRIAGKFMELPKNPPETWHDGAVYRAYATFQLVSIRNLNLNGTLEPGRDDDSNHVKPVGIPANCVLEELAELFIGNSEHGIGRHWRYFRLESEGFKLELEAGNVQLYCGRHAEWQSRW